MVRSTSERWNEHLTGLEYELARERACALGRVGRKFEAALARLAAFDVEHADDANVTRETRGRRAALVNAAGQALWYFIVQREACGLRDSRQIWREYMVPSEVVARMGIIG